MSFGKRPSRQPIADAGAASLAPHDRQQLIPAELWNDPKLGAMLGELGLAPNDESNLAPYAASLEARIAAGRVKHEAKLMRVQDEIASKTNGGKVRAFSLLPNACWNGAHGHFLLMQLNLSPYDDWNMVFLPADERTARLLGQPIHPGGDIPAFVTAADDFLRDCQARHAAAHAQAGRSRDFGAFADASDEIKARIRGLAGFFLGKLTEAWNGKLN